MEETTKSMMEHSYNADEDEESDREVPTADDKPGLIPIALGNDTDLYKDKDKGSQDIMGASPEDSHIDKQNQLKNKKSSNPLLQPIQRRRKRSREKKRREGISAAMKELHDILAKINMDESRRMHMTASSLHEDMSLSRDHTSSMVHTSHLASSIVGGYQQLGQREIIVDAVHTLTHLHTENQRHKNEIMQLTASLISLQQAHSHADVPTSDDSFNSMPNTDVPCVPNYPIVATPTDIFMERHLDLHSQQVNSSSIVRPVILTHEPQSLLDAASDRSDESSADLMEALSNIDSFDKSGSN